MKCHAGVEFPSGKPCPKCNAKLGEVCWPGINADLAALPKLRKALEQILADPPATLDEPDTDAEVVVKIREIARAALAPADRGVGS